MIVKRAPRENPYELIPRSTLQDNRLTIECLGALVRLLSLPEDWKLLMQDVESRLEVGRDKRRKIFEQLIEYGYVIRSKGRNESGMWDWEFTIFPESQIVEPRNGAVGTIDVFSVHGAIVDGSTVDGKHVDIQNTKRQKTHLHKTQQQPDGLSFTSQPDGNGLYFPELPGKVIAEIKNLISVFGTADAQLALDELAARLLDRAHPLRNPVLWMRKILQSGFVLTPGGIAIAERRKNLRRIEKCDQSVRSNGTSNDPKAMAIGIRVIQEARNRRLSSQQKALQP